MKLVFSSPKFVTGSFAFLGVGHRYPEHKFVLQICDSRVSFIVMKMRAPSPATRRVLAALESSTEPVWGLQIIRETGLPSGSVYPILARLESLGMVSSEWESEPSRPGARRRIYMLNTNQSHSKIEAAQPINKTNSINSLSTPPGRTGLAGN